MFLAAKVSSLTTAFSGMFNRRFWRSKSGWPTSNIENGCIWCPHIDLFLLNSFWWIRLSRSLSMMALIWVCNFWPTIILHGFADWMMPNWLCVDLTANLVGLDQLFDHAVAQSRIWQSGELSNKAFHPCFWRDDQRAICNLRGSANFGTPADEWRWLSHRIQTCWQGFVIHASQNRSLWHQAQALWLGQVWPVGHFVLWHNGNGLRRSRLMTGLVSGVGEFWHDISLSCLYWYLYVNLPFNLSLYFSGLS